jgi:hypothetical protein
LRRNTIATSNVAASESCSQRIIALISSCVGQN